MRQYAEKECKLYEAMRKRMQTMRRYAENGILLMRHYAVL